MAISRTSKWYALYRFGIDLGGVEPIPEPTLTVTPNPTQFIPEGESINFSVVITEGGNRPYTITNLPSWLSVSSQTNTGFTLTAVANPDISQRSGSFTVTLNGFTNVYDTVNVLQTGAWVSEFIFKVNVGTVNNPELMPTKIFNIGAVSNGGHARIDWGDSQITNADIHHSSPILIDDPVNANQMQIVLGDDFTHTYSNSGEYTIIVKADTGVDSFKFAALPEEANNAWYVVGQMNEYVTEIIKIQSDYIVNGRRMFSGVKYGWFSANFVLETPNLQYFDYMFEFFGVRDFPLYEPSGGDGRIDYSLQLPINFFSLISNKSLATSATRMYNGSGFLTIDRQMLSFSTALLSTLETFRGMPLVGNNWQARHPETSPLNAGDSQFMPQFVDYEIFWDNPNINKFNGCFWFINDWYGFNILDYPVQWVVRAAMFKGNQGQNIDISYMFRQMNRGVLEANLFRELDSNGVSFGQRIQNANGTFWGALNNSMPRVGATYSLMPAMQSGRSFYGVSLTEYSGNGVPSPNSLFPDLSYPNMTSMVAFFGWRDDGDPPKRSIQNGWQSLPFTQTFGNPFTTIDNWVQNLVINQMSLANFIAKFPNCTTTSGKNPTTNTVDGNTDAFADNFYDFDVADATGAKKASDYDTYNARPTVKNNANRLFWGWGESI